MENNINETPNSPQELFSMQQKCCCNEEDPNALAEYISDVVLPEQDPTPYQTVKAIEYMVTRLRNYHFDILHDKDEDLTEFQQKLWSEDYKHLDKALKHIRLINSD
jgi:hypothetical protein